MVATVTFINRLPSVTSFFTSQKKKKISIQHNAYTTEQSVARLLKQLQKHLVIISAQFPPSSPSKKLMVAKESYNTAIIKVDYKNKLFYLDELIPEEGNQLIKSLKKVQLRTRLDGAILTAKCSLKEIGQNQGISHYVMFFPERINSTQRRDSYRVNIPLNQRIQVNLQTESGDFVAGFLNNLSFNGLSMRLESNPSINLKADESIPFLTLHLKETITCEMKIKRISNSLGSTIISGQFEEINSNHKRFIQKFITQLDRKKRNLK